MIYLAFSGAKSEDWLDNEYIGFWLGGLVLEGKNHFSATRLAFVS
jgi:hypothetical protein